MLKPLSAAIILCSLTTYALADSPSSAQTLSIRPRHPYCCQVTMSGECPAFLKLTIT